MTDLLISYHECLELLGITSQDGEDFDGFCIRPSGVTLLDLDRYGVTLTPKEAEALHAMTPGEFCATLRAQLDRATSEERTAIRMFLAHPRIRSLVAPHHDLLLTHPDGHQRELRQDHSQAKLTPEQEKMILRQYVPLDAPFFAFPVPWAVFKRFVDCAGWNGYLDATKAVDWLLTQGYERQHPEPVVSLKEKANPHRIKEEANLYRIIGALLALLVGKTPLGKPNSSFRTQTAVKGWVVDHYPKMQGVSPRHLDSVFAEANRALKDD